MNPADLEGIPDGALVRLTVEGRVARNSDDLLIRLVQPDDRARWYVLADGSNVSSLLLMVTAVEVLPEPVVEPTGDWALVLDRTGAPWLRIPADSIRKATWRRGYGGEPCQWNRLVEELGPLTVIFEGTP